MHLSEVSCFQGAICLNQLPCSATCFSVVISWFRGIGPFFLLTFGVVRCLPSPPVPPASMNLGPAWVAWTYLVAWQKVEPMTLTWGWAEISEGSAGQLEIQTLPRQGSARVLAAQYPFKKQSCTAQVLQISTSSMQLIGSSNIRPSWSMASYNSTAMTAQVLHAFSCISNGCHALSALLLYILCLLAASLVSCFS